MKGTTLAGARVYLGGAAATFWDIQDAARTDLIIAAISSLALIFLVMLLITRSVVAALVIMGTVALLLFGSLWPVGPGLAAHPWHSAQLARPTAQFIVLVAVGSDYNLLLIVRYLEESKAGLNTGLIRAVAKSGKVVTTAGLVFAVTMMAMLSSDLLSVGQIGSIIGWGFCWIPSSSVRSSPPRLRACSGRCSGGPG